MYYVKKLDICSICGAHVTVNMITTKKGLRVCYMCDDIKNLDRFKEENMWPEDPRTKNGRSDNYYKTQNKPEDKTRKFLEKKMR